jgi:GlpG protein
MRKLAHVESATKARSLSSALQREDIDHEVRGHDDGTAVVWVLEEATLPQARTVLEAWQADPSSYDVEVPAPDIEPNAAPAPPPPGPRTPRQRPRGAYVSIRMRSSRAPVTLLAIGISFAIALASDFGARAEVLQHLTIKAQFTVPGDVYRDLRVGEFWRLVTPAFIHFGVLHLVFNGFWLLDLGGVIERTWGSLRFAFMLVVCAALSNFAQLYFGKSPAFGGLSGVVYACIGYLWARGRFDPTSVVGAPPQLVTFFVVYLLLGFTGIFDALFGAMANYCHLGGLVAGAGYGLVAALRSRQHLRRSTRV